MRENNRFVDDKFLHLEDDIEKVQIKPNMYISYLGKKGTLHLCREIVNNHIDECINKNSPGNVIDIFIDEGEDSLTVSDNGRGIPFENIVLCCTKLQAGSKMQRDSATSDSAGENGVGLTATNALSKLFQITSKRYGEIAHIGFEDGKMTDPLKIKKYYDENEHGTTVKFAPSLKFMGEEGHIDYKLFEEWLEKIICLVPVGISMNFSVKRKGKESSINKTFVNVNGLYDLCNRMLGEKSILKPVHFKDYMRIDDLSSKDGTERFVGIEVAFSFNPGIEEPMIDTFCNFVNTIDRGVHEQAMVDAISGFLAKETRAVLTKKESETMNIINHDVQSSLVLAGFLSTNINPHFTGQTKEKVSNPELIEPIKRLMFRQLSSYFEENKKQLKRITDIIKAVAKARLAGQKARKTSIKGDLDNLSEHEIEDYIPANNKNGAKELYLIEGKSARGAGRNARNTNTQALYSVRGVPPNTFDMTLDEINDKDCYKNLVRILNCNIGPHFDITKLAFDKIIIMTDADIDGHGITASLSGFFLKHMPEIVKAGKLYKALPPLYKLDKKYKGEDGVYIRSKREYVEKFEEILSEHYVIIDVVTNKPLPSKEVTELLMKNRRYLEILLNAANHFCINPLLLEFIATYYTRDNFEKMLKSQFPEISYDSDNKTLSGIVEGQFQVIMMNKKFKKKIRDLENYIHVVNDGKIYYKIHELVGKHKDKVDDKGICSLGAFLLLASKYEPPIDKRYKGLAELNGNELWETTMNPKNRLLLRLTIDDLEKDLERFRIMQTNKGDSTQLKKNFLKGYKISREDIDN